MQGPHSGELELTGPPWERTGSWDSSGEICIHLAHPYLLERQLPSTGGGRRGSSRTPEPPPASLAPPLSPGHPFYYCPQVWLSPPHPPKKLEVVEAPVSLSPMPSWPVSSHLTPPPLVPVRDERLESCRGRQEGNPTPSPEQLWLPISALGEAPQVHPTPSPGCLSGNQLKFLHRIKGPHHDHLCPIVKLGPPPQTAHCPLEPLSTSSQWPHDPKCQCAVLLLRRHISSQAS